MPNTRSTSTELREKKRSIQEEINLRYKLNEKEQKAFDKYVNQLETESVKNKYALMKELEKEAHEDRKRKLKDEGKVVQAW